ncbi:MAG: replication protein [Bacteroidales bacterium]|nr:replication protein [Bacteroidales bacterium]
MASPQKENGYTAIANELLEQLYVAKLNGTQYKVILCIMRYTYGFNRKSHSLSVSFISKATGISRRYVSAELQKLIDQKVVTVVSNHTDSKSRILSINKDHEKWLGCGTMVRQVMNSSTGDELITTTGEELFTTTGEELFTQENKTKTKLKKDIYGEFQNVRLTADEYQKLSTRLNEFEKRIEDLSAYIESTGKKYKSHYATILAWARKDGVYLAEPKEEEEPQKQFESEEQRQAQVDFVSNLLSGKKKSVDLEDLWNTVL